MGRKAEYHLKPKKGPGRKAKKQQAPVFHFKDDEPKQLSRHQKQRAKKRALKSQGEGLGIKPAKNRRWEPDAQAEEDSGSDGQGLDSPDVSEEEGEDGMETLGKPKATLFGDDDDDDEDEDGMDDSDMEEGDDYGSDDDDDEDDIEKMSRKLEKRKEADDAAADAYMAEAASKVAVEIPTLEEVERELQEAPDLPTIQARIKDVAFVLSDIQTRSEPGRSRSEYLAIFQRDLCKYYSYNEFLMKKMMELFSITELIEFLEANERPRPVTLRTNTLKTRRKLLATALIDQGVDVDVITWSKVGLVVMQTPGTVAIGATPQYLAGHYILQGASSYLPVMALAPRCDEKVLDMCAAPGGKSTHIASIMRNTGMLVSNDVNPARVKALVGNFHRMGISNTVISSVDGREFAKTMPNAFDRVLLDAPCSGTGVISKDERVKTSKDGKDIQRCSHLQKELLLAAIDSVHTFNGSSGFVVYSTCSVLVEENEEVIQYALSKRKVRLVPTGLDVGKPGLARFRGRSFHPSLALCKRVYPHSYNMDGFFIAKLQKIGEKDTKKAGEEEEEAENGEAVQVKAKGKAKAKKGQKESANGVAKKKKENLAKKKVVHDKGKKVVVNGKVINKKGKSGKEGKVASKDGKPKQKKGKAKQKKKGVNKAGEENSNKENANQKKKSGQKNRTDGNTEGKPENKKEKSANKENNNQGKVGKNKKAKVGKAEGEKNGQVKPQNKNAESKKGKPKVVHNKGKKVVINGKAAQKEKPVANKNEKPKQKKGKPVNNKENAANKETVNKGKMEKKNEKMTKGEKSPGAKKGQIKQRAKKKGKGVANENQ